MRPPEIENSTEEERREYVEKILSDVLLIVICVAYVLYFRGKDPEVAYADYISGKRDYLDVSKDYR